MEELIPKEDRKYRAEDNAERYGADASGCHITGREHNLKMVMDRTVMVHFNIWLTDDDRSPRRGIEIIHIEEGAGSWKGELGEVAGMEGMTAIEGNVAVLRVGVGGRVLGRYLSDPDVVGRVIGEADGLTYLDGGGCGLE